MFVIYGREYAELCQRFGSAKEAGKTLKSVEKMNNAVLKHGWDGEWFLRAYDAFGNKVGSHKCAEGQIYIEPQGFCSMAGIGVKEGYARAALDSVKKRLKTTYGIQLLSPCYSVYHKELGEVSSYPPGYKENGSIFCHNNPWISIGEAKLGNAEEAFSVYKLICPAYLEEEKSGIHRTEPYAYSQTIAGRETSRFGEAKNSWLTGTAAWSFVSISQAILGVCPGYDGLFIDPCVAGEIGSYKIKRLYRGAEYEITVHNEGKKKPMAVDGKAVEGKTVPYAEGKKHYIIDVYI